MVNMSKLVTSLMAASFIVGCSTIAQTADSSSQRMSYRELSKMTMTCANARHQVAYLKTQRSRGFDMLSSPDNETAAQIANGRYNSIINQKIKEGEMLISFEDVDPGRKYHVCPESLQHW